MSPAVLAFASGGMDVMTQAIAAICAFAALGVVVLVAPWPPVEPSWPLAALGALAAFVAWTVVSVAWAPTLGEAVNDADRVVAYLAIFALAVVVMRLPRLRAAVPDALLWGVAIVVLYALAGRLLPDVFHLKADPAAGDRLYRPIRYWNALGLLSALGVVLSAAVAGNEARPRLYQGAACAAGVPGVLACALTFSRGAWVAGVTGLAVVLLVRPRRDTVVAAAVTVGLGGVLVALLRAFPAVLHLDRGQSAQASQGAPLAVLSLAAVVLAAVVFVWLAGLWRPRGELVVPPSVPAVAPLALVVAALTAAGVVSFASERTEDIPKTAQRATSLKTFRGDYWRIALESFADRPLAGHGTAGFQAEWRKRRKGPEFTFDAHSLYLETLAELGLVGGVLLAALGATLLLGLRRRWRTVPDDPLLAAAAGLLAAFAVHAGLDWDWEVPAVTVPALLIAAAALQRPGRPASATSGPDTA